VSPSASPSPSPGWENYTRGDYANLPADDTNLETNYIAQDYLDVDSINFVYVDQTATAQYAVHQFKDYVGANSCTLDWWGKSNYAPSASKVSLEIYNRLTTTWTEVDFDNATAANTDFELTANIADLTNYKDGSNVISCRVWQLGI
jgi:hypothetical protein